MKKDTTQKLKEYYIKWYNPITKKFIPYKPQFYKKPITFSDKKKAIEMAKFISSGRKYKVLRKW